MMKRSISLIIGILFILNILKSQTMVADSTISKNIDEYFTLLTAQNKFSGSLLINRDGEPIICKGYGMSNYEYGISNTPETIFRIASLSKQFTAFAILQLEEKGLLNTEDYILKYIPDYPNGEKITIHHLLTHRSGIAREKTALQTVKFLTSKQIVDYEKDAADTLLFEPGTDYHYSNVGYNLLAYIIEIVSEKSFEDYLTEYIFIPLGMESSGYYDHKKILKNRAYGYSHDLKNGNSLIASEFDGFNISGAGGLYSTVKDLAIWEKDMSKILSDEGLNKIRTPYTEKGGYGYGVQVVKNHNQLSYLHTGGLEGFMAYLMHLEKDMIDVIFLSNFGDLQLLTIMKDINSILFGEEYLLPKDVFRVAIKGNPVLYQKFSGVYELDLDKTQKFKILEENNKLFLLDNEKEKTELFPETDFVYFFNAESEDGVEFVIDQNNIVTHFNVIIMGTKLKVSKIN